MTCANSASAVSDFGLRQTLEKWFDRVQLWHVFPHAGHLDDLSFDPWEKLPQPEHGACLGGDF